MNTKLIRATAIVTLVPLAAIFLTLSLWGRTMMQLAILLLATGGQVLAIRFCQRELQPLITPTDAVLQAMHPQMVAAAYEPDKYRAELRFCSMLLWAAVPAPLFAFLAKAWPYISPDPARSAVSLSMPWLFLCLGFLFVGMLAPALWARFAQAAAIYHEPSDRRRYQMRGFAEMIDEPEKMTLFQTLTRQLPTV